ncbi:meiotic nuclear division 1 protein, partial [Tubulinosema ratisbonensis]
NDKILEIKNEINQYIDKIYELQSFCGNKFGMDNSTFCENFGIPDDLDYVN